jgi:hypothetical protein
MHGSRPGFLSRLETWREADEAATLLGFGCLDVEPDEPERKSLRGCWRPEAYHPPTGAIQGGFESAAHYTLIRFLKTSFEMQKIYSNFTERISSLSKKAKKRKLNFIPFQRKKISNYSAYR